MKQLASRRDFLKEAGLAAGGLALSQLATACNNPQAITGALETAPASSSAISYTPVQITTASTVSAITTKETTALATTQADSYIPSTKVPPLSEIPGCTSKVAFDRLYSPDHTWVKDLGGGRAAMGITDRLQLLMDLVQNYTPPDAGRTYAGQDTFGYAEGYKMGVDIITPVTMKVIQSNHEIQVNKLLLNNDPYITGWIAYVELVKPEELKSLLSPEQYCAKVAKDIANSK